MYLNHYGLTEPPFRITPHTDFFFSGANRGATLEALLYAITHDEGIVKVTGEVGSGKTMLCRVLIERLPAEVETVYLANPSLEREEILQAIMDDLKFDMTGAHRAGQLLRALQDHLIALYGAGKRVVLLIDEAHAMPPETLEQIRLLSNLESSRHKLLQIALFGQQELDLHLATTLLRPLRERITHSFRLEPLVHADVGQYLMFRLRQAGYKGPDLFDRNALKLIAKSSDGLTRRLNILADKCLLAAYAEGGHGITRKEAVAAIRDCGFAPLGPGRTFFSMPVLRHAGVAAAAIALLTGGGLVGMKLSSLSLPSVQHQPAAVSVPALPATSSVPVPPNVPAVSVPPVLPRASAPERQSNASHDATPNIKPTPDQNTHVPSEQISSSGGTLSTVPATSGRGRPVPLPEPQVSAILSPLPRAKPAGIVAGPRPVLTFQEPPAPTTPDLPPEIRSPGSEN